jgi:hypothetical protein
MERVKQPNRESNSGALRVVRSSHNTLTRSFPKAVAYVVTRDGARIVAGRGASPSAISALHRNAQAAERDEDETSRREWQGRRRAA